MLANVLGKLDTQQDLDQHMHSSISAKMTNLSIEPLVEAEVAG